MYRSYHPCPWCHHFWQGGYGSGNINSRYFDYYGQSKQIDIAESEQLREIGFVGGSHIYKLKNAILFKADMDIDADGAPNAYHPTNDDLALDKREHGEGIFVRDQSGKLCIQEQNGLAPGFLVSPTALYDGGNPNPCDPMKYTNAVLTPYYVLPPIFIKNWGVKVGDMGVVINTKNRLKSYAIFADIGPKNKIGEGSIALAQLLGVDPNPKTGGDNTPSFLYIVFPQSGKGEKRLRSNEEIYFESHRIFEHWGGIKQVNRIQERLKTAKPWPEKD